MFTIEARQQTRQNRGKAETEAIQMATITAPTAIQRDITAGRQRARLRETVLGLLFVGPATLITFVFGLFPVIYGFYVSVQGGLVLPEGFVGLANYLEALGGVAYLFALALAWVLIWGGYQLWKRGCKEMQSGRGNFFLYLFPALIAAPATLGLLALLFTGNAALSPFPIALIALACAVYLALNARLPGVQGSAYIVDSWGTILFTLGGVLMVLFTFSELGRNTAPTFDLLRPLLTEKRFYLPTLDTQFPLLGGLAAALTAFFFVSYGYNATRERSNTPLASILGVLRWLVLLIGGACLIGLLAGADQMRQAVNGLNLVDSDTLSALTQVRPEQLVRDLLAWPQMLALLLGISLIILAYLAWQSASRRETNRGLLTMLLVAIALMIGGWLLIGELPSAVANGDKEFYDSLLRTATYAFLTVPLQLGLGLLLAYLLFHEVNVGKSFYRLIFFIPYIVPTVATATVFMVIFSLADESPANQFMHLLGLPSQQWLRNPAGIFQIIAQLIGGNSVRLPAFLVGPSLPLTTAIIYSTWVFSGYNAVIFMAGLGGVPRELYEAAEVDGAGRWANFRYITLPIISPTTFFLTILSIIGTFQALQHIYVLRQNNARGAMDVATVKIFETIRNGPLPYASAMSFVLFGIILVLTLIQNRVARDQVFYG